MTAASPDSPDSGYDGPGYDAYDGIRLAYDVRGEGLPLVCVPGGPLQSPGYLGGLGGLDRRRRLVLAHLRGTGRSAAPADPASYRCDRLVDDVEALRGHLGLERMDLLGHSGGTNLAVLYAARHPHRVRSLVLVTPSPFAVGLAPSDELRREVARLRAGEPWFPQAYAALEALQAGRVTPQALADLAPLRHGRWDGAARAVHAAEATERNDEGAAVYGSAGAFDPPATRTALAALTAPALLLAGEVDVNSPPPTVAEHAALLPGARLVVQPGAGHFPWLDDAEAFTAAVADFLAGVDAAA
ncbi:alpha/beta hydrolase [Streptomyces sp. NPDC051940]|uniref:alpha/beta fold hydrolase n=1 Tax=Streptomyces sp. NPDC051940 TaxID=3155675 RepID=UPI00342A869E